MAIKISAKTRYGLRILLDLAIHGNGTQRAVKDIAQSQQISEKFISLLAVKLHRGGLIKTVRGMHGGLTLVKQPSNIRLLDVVELMEGPLNILDCLTASPQCDRVGQCTVRQIWDGINQKFIDALAEVSLQDVIDASTSDASTPGQPEYCI
ncbi:MAG: Rrf2 family transcriptional regulator [Victivallales bacterium]|nr:Rrf2 family transcriptional regulator [Victivallales bacterium]